MLKDITLAEVRRMYTASINDENICWMEIWRLYGRYGKRKTPDIRILLRLSTGDTAKMIRKLRKQYWNNLKLSEKL